MEVKIDDDIYNLPDDIKDDYNKVVEVFANFYKIWKKVYGVINNDYLLTEEEFKSVISKIPLEFQLEWWGSEGEFFSIYSFEGNIFVLVNNTADVPLLSFPEESIREMIKVLGKYNENNLLEQIYERSI